MKRSQYRKKAQKERLMRTAYIFGSLIVLGTLCLVLVALITGFGQSDKALAKRKGPDYAANQLCVWSGESLPAADAFLNDSTRSLVDAAKYLMLPQVQVGDQDVAILMQLKDGTTRTENAVLSIREPVIRYEIGSDATPAMLLGRGYENAEISLNLSEITEIGTYPVTVTVDDRTMEFELISQDTTPPKVTPRTDLNFYVNQKLGPIDFVDTCEDMSAVEYHFSKDTATMTLMQGTFDVQLIVTDAAGNSSTLDLIYNVNGDGEPPVFSGIKDMKAMVGIPIDYLWGVTAEDMHDGKTEVTAEAEEGFSVRQPGEYTVTYTTKDEAGNQATETAKLTVLDSLDKVDDLSEDDVMRMGQYIINSLELKKLKPREQLRKIYDYVQGNMYYADNHNIHEWQAGAVIAMYQKYGDCRNYYALARLLLTCAGFDNMMVEKPKPNEWSNAHYWNLVKVEGAWYHFDTTPRNNRSDFFLWTDAQMDAYSAVNGNCFERDKSLYPATPEA